ncbi:MAG: reverse transcriptase N-terminal domain-containing protein, partial [Methanobrevibacter sp.]|nr:reverse transcriptase N-terminal domain-containing protein [Methanobrevibacter sp.]
LVSISKPSKCLYNLLGKILVNGILFLFFMNNIYSILKSSTPYTTIWSDIHWIKIEKYVNKLQKRIYHAKSVNESPLKNEDSHIKR